MAGANAPLSHSIQPPAGVHAGTQTRHTRCALSEGQPQQGGTSGGDGDPTRNDHWSCGLGSAAVNSIGVSARCVHSGSFLKRILQGGLGTQRGVVQGGTAVYQQMTLAPGRYRYLKGGLQNGPRAIGAPREATDAGSRQKRLLLAGIGPLHAQLCGRLFDLPGVQGRHTPIESRIFTFGGHKLSIPVYHHGFHHGFTPLGGV